MRIEQLHYAATVARLGSFRQAAEELHLSQPALSATVRNLERELGVAVLDRGRTGAKISAEGRELLPHLMSVLEAVDALRRAADEQRQGCRIVRVATVNAATVGLLTPAIRAFRMAHPGTQIEVIGALPAQIDAAVIEGSVDLGLLTRLTDDDHPPELEATVLLRGEPVVCIRTDSPLAASDRVRVDELFEHPLISLRSGYLMNRFVHRLAGDATLAVSYLADGPEMAKLMVADGLGMTLLPDFNVLGDPLERRGVITCRPLSGEHPEILLVLQRRRARFAPQQARDLHAIFVERAQAFADGSGPTDGNRLRR
ncbi:MAG: hypothetical protein V7607_1430 [Solirubrobacteraceae bacterium]